MVNLTVPQRRALLAALAAVFLIAVTWGPGPGRAQSGPASAHAETPGPGAVSPVIRDGRGRPLLDAYRDPDGSGFYRFDTALVTRTWLWLLVTCRDHGWTGRLNGQMTGLRTWQQQNTLHERFLAGKGAPAFDPDGPSRHMIANVGKEGAWYQAVDAVAPQGLIACAAGRGIRLHTPYPAEPWHVEAEQSFAAPDTWGS